MTDLATARRPTTPVLGVVSILLTAAAVIVYGLAGWLDEGLYPVCGLLGIAAFAAGRRARAGTTGRRRTVLLVSMSIGGLLGAAVAVSFVVWGVAHLV